MKTLPLGFLALASLFFGCKDLGTNPVVPTPGGRPLDASVNGGTVMCPPGGSFALALDLHFDSGYAWVTVISDPSVIHLDSTSFRQKEPGPPVIGGMVVETFHFRASAPGTCSVLLQELRPWEKMVNPINTVQFAVTVQG